MSRFDAKFAAVVAVLTLASCAGGSLLLGADARETSLLLAGSVVVAIVVGILAGFLHRDDRG